MIAVELLFVYCFVKNSLVQHFLKAKLTSHASHASCKKICKHAWCELSHWCAIQSPVKSCEAAMLIGEETLYKEKLQESLTQWSQVYHPLMPRMFDDLARMEDKLLRLGEGKPDKELWLALKYCAPDRCKVLRVFESLENVQPFRDCRVFQNSFWYIMCIPHTELILWHKLISYSKCISCVNMFSIRRLETDVISSLHHIHFDLWRIQAPRIKLLSRSLRRAEKSLAQARWSFSNAEVKDMMDGTVWYDLVWCYFWVVS